MMAGLCRATLPKYKLIVLNRLSPDDLHVDVSVGFEWQRQGQYFTFRHKDDPSK